MVFDGVYNTINQLIFTNYKNIRVKSKEKISHVKGKKILIFLQIF